VKRFEYIPSPLPLQLDVTLLDWLRREFANLKLGLASLWDMPVTTVAPERPAEGMLRYADGTAWNPGGGKGVYVYNGTAWVKL
jgi:hypothetical protein